MTGSSICATGTSTCRTATWFDGTPLPATLLLLYGPDEIVTRQLVIRPETDGLLTGPDAFVPVRLRVVCRGDVVPGFPIIRAQFESFARRLDRFVKLTLLVESQRSVEISLRGRSARSLEPGPRFRAGGEPSERLIDCMTKKIRVHLLRIEFHQ